MILKYSMFIWLLCLSNLLVAQESISDERAATARLESSIQIALGMDTDISISQLELIDEQKTMLEKLHEDYQNVVEDLIGAGDDNSTIEARRAIYRQQLARLQNTLDSKILLPHQSVVLQSKVFGRFLKHAGGSILKALESYYREEFALSDEQKKGMKEVEKVAGEKVSAAKERFKKELEQIAEEMRQDVRKVLTPDQAGKLDKFHDRK